MTTYRNKRAYRPGRRTAEAYCIVCNREWKTNNCQGIAARHTDQTGHMTIVEVTQCHVYYLPGREDP